MSLDNEKFHLDELTLQRLVDGELSHDQVRQLLAEAEFGDDPTNWKKIALAFAENQMFERAIGQNESTASDNSMVVELPKRPVTGQESKTSPIRGSRSTSNSWWPAVLAASLLLALTVVYQISEVSPKIDDNSVVHSSPTVDSPSSVPDSRAIESFDRRTLASYEPDHQLKAKDINAASIGKHNSSIPLYDIGRLNPEQLANLRGDDRAAREAMFSRVLPQGFSPEVVQQLQQSGGMVDQNLEFISGRLDDGRSYLIPYRTIRFLPGQ